MATTIDEVIARLEGIIEDSSARGDRAGYFAALYNRVTRTVRDGIARGQFEDGARMARLDVAFANRYLAAFDAWQAGELPSRSWVAAFGAFARGDLTVLQHLVLGMNAHINLDLGIAAARTCPGDALPALRADFYSINDVLASLLGTVENEMAAIEPLFGFFGRVGQSVDGALSARFIDEARDGAWRFATEIGALPLEQQMAAIARRDLEVAALGSGLIGAAPFARLLASGEGTDVGRNVRVLAEGEMVFKLSAAPG